MAGPARGAAHAVARAAGWVSLALGLGLLAAPRALSRLGGVDDSPVAPVMARLVGVRELGHAAVLLGSRRPAPWAWTRVAGDAVDLTLLALAMQNRGGTRRVRTAIAAGAVAGITAVDVVTATAGIRRGRTMLLRAAVTVNRPSEEVYRFWHDFENLPRFMDHLESVRSDGDGRRSRWRARGPAGSAVEWDAEIVEDRPNQIIVWCSVEGASVPNRGRVRFSQAAGGRGTEVRVEMEYAPPGGALGKAVATIFGEEPGQQVRDDLRRFKQVVETGEVVRSEGSPRGLSVRQQVMQRPARPMAGAEDR